MSIRSILEPIVSNRRMIASATIGVVVGLAVCCTTTPLQAEPGHTGHTFEQGMDVRLSFDKTDIVVGETVHLVMDFTNITAVMKYGNIGAKFFYSEGNDVNITVQPPGELPYRYTAAEDPGVYPSVEIDLERNKSMHYDMPMVYDSTQQNGYVFSKPGDYVISARLTSFIMRDPQRFDTVTPATRIHVRAPEGRAAQAFRLIANPACARALQLSFATDPDSAEKIAKVAKEFADTPYGTACQYSAAMQLMENSPPNFKASAQAMEEFVRQHPDYTRIGSAIFNVAYAWDKAGEPGLAGDWFQLLRKRDPGYCLLRKENELAYRYFYGGISPEVYNFWWLREEPWTFKPPMKRDL